MGREVSAVSIAIEHPRTDVGRAYPAGRVTVREYDRMIETGELTEADPVELLSERIVVKMSRGPRHDSALELIQAALAPLLAAGCRLRIQSAIVTRDSEPEPDAAVVRGTIRTHASRHPTAAETLLVIEVADSSLAEDRNRKLGVYAAAGIPIYWILNIVDRELEIHREPTVDAEGEPTYAVRHDFRAGESVPVVLDGIEVGRVSVNELLP